MASTAYNSASVIIPKGAGYKASTIYGWRPSVNILQSIGITRNDANGSFRNQQGLIEFAAANVPRFNWDEGDSCPKLLVEPSRENLFTYSEQFDNAAWGKTGAAVTPNSTTSPDGTSNADLIIEDTSTGNHRVDQAKSVTTGVTYTLSCFAKIGTGNRKLQLLCLPAGIRGYFDLETGGSNIENGTGEIIDMGNGFYFCSVTGVSTVTGFQSVRIQMSNSLSIGSESYTGDGTSSIYVWGAQLEEGSYATSYIKTEATTQTRAADVISQTGLASLIGDSEGTLYLEAEVFDATNDFISLSDGTNSNRCSLDINGSSFRFEVLVGGATQASISGGSYTSGVIYKAACSYAVNSFAFYVDGTQIGTDVSGSTFADATLTNIELNTGNGSGAPFYGKISVLAWWQARLSNSVLESLTSYETYEEMAATLDYTID